MVIGGNTESPRVGGNPGYPKVDDISGFAEVKGPSRSTTFLLKLGSLAA